MTNEQCVGQVNEHVKPLPDWGGQVGQPKVVTRCSHEDENHKRNDTKQLEWEINEGPEVGVARKEADDGFNVTPLVIPIEHEVPMVRSHEC